MRNSILKIAIPSIVSNITVPLLALVDTTIVGHFGADARLTDAPAEQPGAAVYLGAIAVGGMLFNMIYWLFSFLRMGTGGMTAQACGARQTDETLRILLRSLMVATGIALLFILFKAPLLGVFFQFMEASADTEMLARQYIDILVFGAPAVLGLYSFTGWFLGMQNAKYPMYIAIVQNIVNIGVSLWLVMALHWRVAGVAVGTLVAQYAGLLMALLLWRRHYGHLLSRHALKTLWQRGALKRFFTVNRDIFLRTLCLVGVTSCFTAFGTAMGDAALAANTLLMQFFVLFSYIMDGFAYAGEALGGRYVGEGNEGSFRRLTKSLFLWGAALVGLYSLVYVAGGESFLRLLTKDASVVAAALCHPSGERRRLHLRRSFHRRHRHTPDAAINGGRHAHVFRRFPPQPANKRLALDSLSLLPRHARTGAGTAHQRHQKENIRASREINLEKTCRLE